MATQVQSQISEVLAELKFQNLGADMPGAPNRFQATADTLQFMHSLLDESKVIEVDSQGGISFVSSE